jgi:predicted Zn-dependent protease
MRYPVALFASLGLAFAAEDPAPAKKAVPAGEPVPAEEPAGDPVPAVDAVISERVKKLPKPTPPAIPKGLARAVSASDPAAQKHVLDGMANLQGGWDFEAYRHFCAALELDPECLMAHWGAVMALIDPEPDLLDERTAALRRMVALVENEVGTELERSYAYAVAVFFDKGPAAAADAFRKVSERYPNDPQLKLMAALFGRAGYGDDGKPKPAQEEAEVMLDEMLTRDPDHPVYLYAYLTIRAEAPDLRGDLARARRLVELAPDHPPFLHLLGHYEHRSGNATLAAEAFARAAEGYGKWMKDTGLAHADCPGWVKAESYRAAALAAKGDYANALAIAKAVAAIPLPAERAASEGGRLLLWEGRTLPARLLMRRSRPGDVALALASLPKPADQKIYEKLTLSTWFYQGLAFLLEARKALDAGKPEEARQILDALAHHGELMAKTREAAIAGGERSAWLRAFTGLQVAASELRGLIAMAGPKAAIAPAFNWFRSALDGQTPPSMLMPPTILMPMQARLADFHLARGEAQAAVDILIEAQARHTNDLEVLTRLQKALALAGHPGQAELVGKEIEKVKAE